MTEGVARELADLPCDLDAGRAGSDDDERQQRGATIVIGLDLGGLERAQEMASDDERTLERLHLGGVLTPFVVAEVRVARPARDDQRVVGEGFRAGNLAGLPEEHLA